jgi:hypothetical protein
MNSFPIDMQHRIFERVMFSIARKSAADIESKARIPRTPGSNVDFKGQQLKHQLVDLGRTVFFPWPEQKPGSSIHVHVCERLSTESCRFSMIFS